MNIIQRPKFMDSSFFVMEMGNWHLKDGAPKDTIEEFDKFQEDMKKREGVPNGNDTGSAE